MSAYFAADEQFRCEHDYDFLAVLQHHPRLLVQAVSESFLDSSTSVLCQRPVRLLGKYGSDSRCLYVTAEITVNHTNSRGANFSLLANFTSFSHHIQVECDRLTVVAMKQTLGRQVGEVREHECNMHVCVGVGSHWLKLLQTILLF